MCTPLVAIAIGAAGAATGADLYAQERQFREARRSRRENLRINVKNAAKSATIQYQGLQDRLSQEREASALESQENLRQLLQATGRIRVAAGERGVGGQAAVDLEQDASQDLQELEGARRRNLAFLEQSILNTTVEIQERQRLVGEQSRGSTLYGPDYLSSILNFVSTSAVAVARAQQPRPAGTSANPAI